MLGFAARLIGGAFTPLIDQASTASARLLRKFALFVFAGICLLVVVIALTVAFDLWVSSMKGPIVGALAVAGLYLVVAAIALFIATRGGRTADAEHAPQGAAADARRTLDSEVDAFAEPLMQLLRRFGLRREQIAVLAGLSVAKRIGPVPLVGLAILAGFLIGRLGRGLFPSGLIDTLMASDLVSALFGQGDAPRPDEERRDAA